MRNENHLKYIAAISVINKNFNQNIDTAVLENQFEKFGFKYSFEDYVKTIKEYEAFQTAISTFKELASENYADSAEILASFNRTFSKRNDSLLQQFEQFKASYFEEKYNQAKASIDSNQIDSIEKGIELLDKIGIEYKDVERVKAGALDKLKRLRKKKTITIVSFLSVISIVVLAIVMLTTIILPNKHIATGKSELEKGNYDQAIEEFGVAGNEEMVFEAKYQKAISLMQQEEFKDAEAIFTEIEGYSDSSKQKQECEKALKYLTALDDMDRGNYSSAYEQLSKMRGYKETDSILNTLHNVPTEIQNSNLCTYTFSYDKNGKMTNAKASYNNGNTWSYSFDGNGKLVSTIAPDRGNVRQGSYSYEIGVIKLQFTGESNYTTFDTYGNYYYKTPKNLDKHNNSMVAGKTNIYNSDGFLEKVNSTSNDDTTIKYSIIYSDSSIDMDLIWRNIRLIASDRIWY